MCLPVAIHLKTAEGSSMSSLSKATIHLCISNFKFSSYQKLIFYSTLISRRDTLYHIVGIQIDNHSYRGKAHFLFTPDTLSNNIISQ